jgi:biopolymer transport protein ExbB
MDAGSCKPVTSPGEFTARPLTESRARQHWLLLGAIVAILLISGSAHAAGESAAAKKSTKKKTQATAAGDRSAPAIPTKRLLNMARDGGMLMIPIGACSVILMVFVFERAASLRRARIIPRPFVRRFLEQVRDEEIDQKEALKLCRDNGSPVAMVLQAAVKKWGRSAVEVEQAILDEGERISNGLRKYLRLFNGISTITPLMGLLGTVTGMIGAFNEIAGSDAMGRPEMLAGGISQALLTTAAGLSVAIPALCAYLYFAGVVDKLIVELDAVGQKAVDLLAIDGWRDELAAEQPSRSSSKRTKRSAA